MTPIKHAFLRIALLMGMSLAFSGAVEAQNCPSDSLDSCESGCPTGTPSSMACIARCISECAKEKKKPDTKTSTQAVAPETEPLRVLETEPKAPENLPPPRIMPAHGGRK